MSKTKLMTEIQQVHDMFPDSDPLAVKCMFQELNSIEDVIDRLSQNPDLGKFHPVSSQKPRPAAPKEPSTRQITHKSSITTQPSPSKAPSSLAETSLDLETKTQLATSPAPQPQQIVQPSKPPLPQQVMQDSTQNPPKPKQNTVFNKPVNTEVKTHYKSQNYQKNLQSQFVSIPPKSNQPSTPSAQFSSQTKHANLPEKSQQQGKTSTQSSQRAGKSKQKKSLTYIPDLEKPNATPKTQPVSSVNESTKTQTPPAKSIISPAEKPHETTKTQSQPTPSVNETPTSQVSAPFLYIPPHQKANIAAQSASQTSEAGKTQTLQQQPNFSSSTQKTIQNSPSKHHETKGASSSQSISKTPSAEKSSHGPAEHSSKFQFFASVNTQPSSQTNFNPPSSLPPQINLPHSTLPPAHQPNLAPQTNITSPHFAPSVPQANVAPQANLIHTSSPSTPHQTNFNPSHLPPPAQPSLSPAANPQGSHPTPPHLPPPAQSSLSPAATPQGAHQAPPHLPPPAQPSLPLAATPQGAHLPPSAQPSLSSTSNHQGSHQTNITHPTLTTPVHQNLQSLQPGSTPTFEHDNELRLPNHLLGLQPNLNHFGSFDPQHKKNVPVYLKYYPDATYSPFFILGGLNKK